MGKILAYVTDPETSSRGAGVVEKVVEEMVISSKRTDLLSLILAVLAPSCGCRLLLALSKEGKPKHIILLPE